LLSGGFDRVEECEGLRAGAHEPHSGVRVDPVFERHLFQCQGLEVLGVQVLSNVLICAHQQDVCVEPQREGEL
jgi:hypothetical protein